MKKVILFALTILYLNTNAQTNNCDEKVNNLLINKVKAYNSKDLIPYFSKKENKWGYIHKITKKILTTPILSDAYFFHPTLRFYYSFEQDGSNSCNGQIASSKEGYKIIKNGSSPREGNVSYVGKEKTDYKKFAKPEVAGFEVNEKGNLTYFNPKYYDEKENTPSINNIFKVKGEYCAVAVYEENGKRYYTVINQKGIAFKGFEKLDYYIQKKQSYSNENDVWFLIEIAKETYIFKSLVTGRRLPETFTYSPNWQNHAQQFGYAIFTIGKQNGLLDLTTMQWKIKPSVKNDFQHLYYASSEPLEYNYDKDEYSYDPTVVANINMINSNRKKCFIYIQNSKNEFLDLGLKLYKPGK